MSSSNEKTWTESISENFQGAKDAVVGPTKKEVSKTKEETAKHQADSSAGSTWDNIKDAASSAKDQAANKVDKNTSEAKAKTREGGDSLSNSAQKAGAKADEKEAKADTKGYLASAWEGTKDTVSSLTDAAGHKADKNKHEAGAKTTETREKLSDKMDPHKSELQRKGSCPAVSYASGGSHRAQTALWACKRFVQSLKGFHARRSGTSISASPATSFRPSKVLEKATMARGLLLWRSCLLSCLLSAWVSTAQPVEAPSGTPAATVLNGPAVAPAISPAAAAEGGADVVYIRSEALWNVTNLSGTFSSAVQTNFTTALRQLLEPEQFMSIALTSITAQQPAGSYMVDSSLVVGAPIAQASASFEQVAYESIINKTLGPDFKQLLAAQGVNCDVQLNKLTGKTEAASTAIPLVNVVTNVTVTGVDISQLLSQALAPNATGPSITTPLQQQIQVDPAQNVSITPTGVSGQNQ
ncbi:hypothetical protein WJX84_004257, partial [Apatococcus fuscideae]